MSSRYGPLEIRCDAPPYTVTRACERLGFQTPLDVRWLRLSHYLQTLAGSTGIGLQPWKLLLGLRQPREKICTCGQPMPVVERFTFTFRSEKKADYLLGQCRRCRTIFWEELTGLAAGS